MWGSAPHPGSVACGAPMPRTAPSRARCARRRYAQREQNSRQEPHNGLTSHQRRTLATGFSNKSADKSKRRRWEAASAAALLYIRTGLSAFWRLGCTDYFSRCTHVVQLRTEGALAYEGKDYRRSYWIDCPMSVLCCRICATESLGW